MSIRALNQLLGQSTIDPALAKAYEQGRIEEILADYDFSPEMRRELKALEAVTFDDFAAEALDLIAKIESDWLISKVPDPRQGLCVDAVVGDEEQAA